MNKTYSHPVYDEINLLKYRTFPQDHLKANKANTKLINNLHMITVNQTTAGNDLTGAKVVRIRTMARFLDAANFSGAINPFGTPDSTAEFPQEIYYIDRKSAENREIVSWELAAVFDLAGIRSPKRQCTRSLFPSIGTFTQ